MADILIGGSRRPKSWRPRARHLFGIAVALAIGTVLTWYGFLRATELEPPDGDVAHAVLTAAEGRLVLGAGDTASSLERVGRVRVLRLRGAPRAIGHAQGVLVGIDREITDALDAALRGWPMPRGWFDARRTVARFRWRHRRLDEGVPPALAAELAGLAAATGTSYAALIHAHAAPDLGRALAMDEIRGAAVAALTIAVTPTTLLGHSFAVTGVGPGDGPVLRIVQPTEGIPFAAVGWAGQVGVVTGINAHQLAILVHPAASDDVQTDAVRIPIMLLARRVLGEARDLEGAIALIRDSAPLGAAAFVIVDGKTRRWAVVERSPRRVSVQEPSRLAVGDVLVARPFETDPANARLARTTPHAARAARGATLLAAAAGTPFDVAVALRDRRDAAGHPLPAGNGNAVDDTGAQHTVILDPSRFRLWISEGPGASGRFVGFDLRVELLGEPARPEELTVPADTALPPGDASRFVAASHHLARAHALAVTGDRAAARDESTRALALAPALAEAHKLAADLARAAGDAAAARLHDERFLALQPARRDWIDEVRARLGKR